MLGFTRSFYLKYFVSKRKSPSAKISTMLVLYALSTLSSIRLKYALSLLGGLQKPPTRIFLDLTGSSIQTATRPSNFKSVRCLHGNVSRT